MKSSLHFVIDTNTVVSALLIPDSAPRRAFDRAVDQGKILISLAALVELNQVLTRKKFDKSLTEEKREEFLAALVNQAKFVKITETITECRDPKDNKFLELAVCGGADCLISGDGDLLALHPFRGIRILPPQAFLNEF